MVYFYIQGYFCNKEWQWEATQYNPIHPFHKVLMLSLVLGQQKFQLRLFWVFLHNVADWLSKPIYIRAPTSSKDKGH